MKENKKKTIRTLLLIFILLLGIGFAALTTQLKINGTVNVSRTAWDVHFENVSITEGSVTANPAPTSDDTTTTEMTYTINFTKPGDYFEFTTDIVNEGTIDAMVDVVSNNAYQNASSTTPITLPTYLTSTVTYDDGVEILPNQELLHNTSEKIKVRVEFKKDISSSDLPSSGDTSIVFKFIGDYKQADENSKPIRIDFSTASWDEITTAYENDPFSLRQSMVKEKTKEIQIDLDFDGTIDKTVHVRIANLTTPAECSTEGFSQSACGLVIEFSDIILGRQFNKMSTIDTPENGLGNKGGWEYSDVRAYLNGGKYREGLSFSGDYTNAGILQALPSELQSKIIDTKVVSGHGPNDTDNFTTTDKLYLLSLHEVYEDKDNNPNIGPDRYDTAYYQTRQLDYYNYKNVTGDSNQSYTKKKNNGTTYDWWVRVPYYNNANEFYYINGGYGHASQSTCGYSPAFRIA